MTRLIHCMSPSLISIINIIHDIKRLYLLLFSDVADDANTIPSSIVPEAIPTTNVTGSCACDKANNVYYHRELLINSVEGRRIDLLTISSFHGIQHETEPRLSNLFSNENEERSHLFKDKKVTYFCIK